MAIWKTVKENAITVKEKVENTLSEIFSGKNKQASPQEDAGSKEIVKESFEDKLEKKLDELKCYNKLYKISRIVCWTLAITIPFTAIYFIWNLKTALTVLIIAAILVIFRKIILFCSSFIQDKVIKFTNFYKKLNKYFRL
ncbi:MAG: hypothetical protein HUK21_06385, partial [Fibrobacteraceae bacterium]|nr:hypothetical protein [Fibrobacteraceae bacterium]